MASPILSTAAVSFADRPLSKAVVALSNLESNSFSREAVLTAMELVAAALPAESAAGLGCADLAVPDQRSPLSGRRPILGHRNGSARRRSAQEFAENLKVPDRSTRMRTRPAEVSHPFPLAARRLESAKALRAGWQLLMEASSGWPAGLSWEDWAEYLNRDFEPLLGASEDWPAFSSVLDEIGNLDVLDRFEIRIGFEIRDSRFEIETKNAEGGRTADIRGEDEGGAGRGDCRAFLCRRGSFSGAASICFRRARRAGLRFPLVIIPGLDEGRFPAKLRQDPLLLDSERRRIGRLPLKSRRMEEERLLFDMAARSAEKRLVLMTSRLDESSDRERIPSQFFLRAAAAIRKSVVTIRDLTEGNIPGFRSVSLDNPAPDRRRSGRR